MALPLVLLERIEATSDFYGRYLLIEYIGDCGDLLRQFFAIQWRFISPTFHSAQELLLPNNQRRRRGNGLQKMKVHEGIIELWPGRPPGQQQGDKCNRIESHRTIPGCYTMDW